MGRPLPKRGELWVWDCDGTVFMVDDVWMSGTITYLDLAYYSLPRSSEYPPRLVSSYELGLFLEHFTPLCMPPVTVYRHG